MPLYCQHQIGGNHPLAVVGDANEPPPAAIGEHIDPVGAGVERVLDEFLHHARRTLHHFAGGNPVDNGLGKLADRHARLACGRRV
jgi:hypothetical protein